MNKPTPEEKCEHDWSGCCTEDGKVYFECSKCCMEVLTKVDWKNLLQDYSEWLEERGYLDDDWRCEDPKAVEEYLKERKL